MHPIALAGVHLIDSIVELIEQLRVVLTHDAIDIISIEHIQCVFVFRLAEGVGNNGLHLASEKGSVQLSGGIIEGGLVGEALCLRPFLEQLIGAVLAEGTDAHTVIGCVITGYEFGVVGTHVKQAAGNAGRLGEGKDLLTLRRFLRISKDVQLTVLQHLQQLVPVFPVADIFYLDVHVTLGQLPEVDGVAGKSAVGILLAQTVLRKHADADSAALVRRLACCRSNRCQQNKKSAAEDEQCSACNKKLSLDFF